MRILLKRYGNLSAAIFLLLLSPINPSSAGTSARTVSHYNVISKGFTIGDVKTTQRLIEKAGVAGVYFETKTTIKASFLWMGYHLDTLEKGTLLNGDLVNYSRKGSENGDSIDIEGRLENSSFKFEVKEHGAVRTIIIPRNSYDYTTVECPEARHDFSDKTDITLKILDIDKLAVVKRDYHLVRNSLYSIGGKELPCRIVDFSDKNKKIRRWINWDGSAVVLYRQDSSGEKNPYSVQATLLTKEI